LSTTSTQQNENMAAIGSRPIRAHHSSHVHASFLHGIELCCIRCKKLVQEKYCTRNHVRRSSFLYKWTCTSFLYKSTCTSFLYKWTCTSFLCKFLDCVSPPLQRQSWQVTTDSKSYRDAGVLWRQTVQPAALPSSAVTCSLVTSLAHWTYTRHCVTCLHTTQCHRHTGPTYDTVSPAYIRHSVTNLHTTQCHQPT